MLKIEHLTKKSSLYLFAARCCGLTGGIQRSSVLPCGSLGDFGERDFDSTV